MIADHAPHELLGMDDYFWPAIVAALAVVGLVVFVCRGVKNWTFPARLGIAAAVATSSLLPATIAGYCSRDQFIGATFGFAIPAVIAIAARARNRGSLRVVAWLAAAVATVAYIAAVRWSCWDDSYEFDNTYYQVRLVAPSVLVFGAVMYRPGMGSAVKGRLAARMSALQAAASRARERLPRIPPASPARLTVIMRWSVVVKRLLIVPIIAGLVMLPTVLFTIPGAVLLATSAGLWRAATSAHARGTSWTLHGSVLLAFTLVCTVAGCVALVVWAAGEGFSFSSAWSELGIIGCLAWSAGMVTAGTRILSRRS